MRVRACMRACAMCLQYTIIDILPRLIMIIIKIIILYFIQIRHTDDFSSTGTRLVCIIYALYPQKVLTNPLGILVQRHSRPIVQIVLKAPKLAHM